MLLFLLSLEARHGSLAVSGLAAGYQHDHPEVEKERFGQIHCLLDDSETGAPVIEVGYVHAFQGAFLKGLREGRDFDTFVMGLATGVPTAAVVAWVANSRGDEAIFTYLCVGVVLFGVWNGAAFRTGFSLQTEFFLGTLGPSLLTRTPLFVILAGRVASDLALGLVTAVGGVLTIAASADVPLRVASVPLFAVSAVFGYVTLLCLGLVLSPGHHPNE